MSVVSSPIAEVMPGIGRHDASRECPASPRPPTPCSGPAPPKATSAKPRGSMPFCTVRERMAFAMLELMMVRMPSAASLTARPSSSASRATDRLRARPDRGVMPPPRKSCGSSRPSTRLASVTVGASPPRAIGGRTGHRAGALRADAEGAAAVDMRDRAAAGADRVDVDHRHQQREAGDRGRARIGLGEHAVDDDADIGAGAADVEGDQALPLDRSPIQAPPSTPAARPESKRQRRLLASPSSAVATPPLEAMMRRSPLHAGSRATRHRDGAHNARPWGR